MLTCNNDGGQEQPQPVTEKYIVTCLGMSICTLDNIEAQRSEQYLVHVHAGFLHAMLRR